MVFIVFAGSETRGEDTSKQYSVGMFLLALNVPSSHDGASGDVPLHLEKDSCEDDSAAKAKNNGQNPLRENIYTCFSTKVADI